MSVYESKRSVPLGSVAIYRVVDLFGGAIEALAARRRVRATEGALSRLSDQQLRDIGLHRGEIVELAESLARR